MHKGTIAIIGAGYMAKEYYKVLKGEESKRPGSLRRSLGQRPIPAITGRFYVSRNLYRNMLLLR